ncbi:Creatinase aminopeptidase [Mycena sanguinolenta]|uniref:Creatinase aminopeptidase n=1 Tax=Mycena sanguinolenta TaxID=230812 RepID=A0A8H6ZFW9_9AGAR|nr:Creatinase aminopeptidase [Mycena sanguinolenta]
MAPPPPPPPPLCFPFNKPRRRLSMTESDISRPSYDSQRRSIDSRRPTEKLVRYASQSSSSSAMMPSTAVSLAFKSDSEDYNGSEIRKGQHPEWEMGKKGPRLVRTNTMTGTKKAVSKGGWGYGWGLGKKKEVEEADLGRQMSDREMSEKMVAERLPSNGGSRGGFPLYDPPVPPVRTDTGSSRRTRDTRESRDSRESRERGRNEPVHLLEPRDSTRSKESKESRQSKESKDSRRSKESYESRQTKMSNETKVSSQSRTTQRSTGGQATAGTQTRNQTPLVRNDSNSTLVGSIVRRKDEEQDAEPSVQPGDTGPRLHAIRELMLKDNLNYYIVPSEDAHQSEYVAASDRRREYVSGFTGSSGEAIISMNSAYLITDSRYWLQAQQQLDPNWTLVEAGGIHGPKDWIEWLVSKARDSRIGIDARMISHEKATLISNKLATLDSKMIYPPQNLVDLAWKDKPAKSREPLFRQPIEFTGQEAHAKLHTLRQWIASQPPSVPAYSKTPPTESQIHVGTLLTNLAGIAYLLNLRGSDIPFNPLFQAYLFVSLDKAVLFVDSIKCNDEIMGYLNSLGVERRDYVDLWQFLRRREWGVGKILISPQTSFAISLMLTHFRYTVAPSFVEEMMAFKNGTEIEGLRRAYLRDGACFVRFLAWLEAKVAEGYDITEFEAAQRLTQFRRKSKHIMGLAYENISASGPNAALPHYTPKKSTARIIDRETPYLNDSGGQYLDGTCDTTRTVHLGRPTPEQMDAFTRVLQGHIAIDSAVFPEGTSGHQLDVLARKALWQDGLNYGHGTGHGFGSFLTVHEGSYGFSSSVPLMPGHVVTNEPGFYSPGRWGIRIESALAVVRVKTRGEFNGPIWLGFERLTCVPIQTRMVKDGMLTKGGEAVAEGSFDHNQRCYQMLSPLLTDDKRAMKWLKREADRGIGIANGITTSLGSFNVDWD